MRRLSHQTLGARKYAVAADLYYDFKPGDRVFADGFPGKVTAVLDGPFPGTESYDVTLDGGVGGGQYLARQLYSATSTTAASDGDQYEDGVGGDSDADLSPIEAAARVARADFWYPELGSILEERVPNEQIRVFAKTASAADGKLSLPDDPNDETYPMIARHNELEDHIRSLPGGWRDWDARTPRREQAVLKMKLRDIQYARMQAEGALQEPIDEDDDAPAPYGATHGTEDPDALTTKLEESEENAVPGDSSEQPDTCSWCGSQNFTDFQDTGRGTRARCATCGGTMVKNPEGIQWAPEFPNSSQNAASRAGDPRATINDPRSVHGTLNAAASQEAGFLIFSSLDPAMQGVADRIAQLLGIVHTGDGEFKLHREASQQDPEFLWHFTSSWRDVQAKAKRIRAEGGVRVVAVSGEGAVGEVRGDTATYEAIINYVPGTKKVADWSCGCKWAAYAWGRSPKYRRFEGRQCSHVAALRFEVGARGMFGRDVTPDAERMDDQFQRSPVQVQYQRPTTRAPERDLTRRTVPPGNMRREWGTS